MDKAGKRYLVRFGSAMAAYVVTLMVAVLVVKQIGDSPWRYALMLLPVVPIVGALLAFLTFFEAMDELQKRIQLYALAFSAGGTAMFGLVYGLLETVGMPHLPWVWVFPIVVGLWGLGAIIASKRYA